jgi:hypothetical protein
MKRTMRVAKYFFLKEYQPGANKKAALFAKSGFW